jgi:hypothetical protein
MSTKIFCLDKMNGRIALGIGTMEPMPELKGSDGTLIGAYETNSWVGAVLVIEVNAGRNDGLIRKQDSIVCIEGLKLGHDSSPTLGADRAIEDEHGVSQIFKEGLQIINCVCKIDSNHDFLLRMPIQGFDRQITKEINLSRLDDLKTASNARHSLRRIAAKADMSRTFIEGNGLFEKFDSSLDDFNAFEILLRLKGIALEDLDRNGRRKHCRRAVLLEHVLKEPLNLGNQGSIGSLSRRRPLDGIGRNRIEDIALVKNFLEPDPIHPPLLKIIASEDVTRLNIQSTKKIMRLLGSINR